ncbi:phage tail tip fiber protein [Photobacterium nomapromontoriensis]|uniref:phage tail tip fiber protein n=1 Tax=Photobacterium nomapromontoriensis TaxID=2910237 RepID=UPI003D095991
MVAPNRNKAGFRAGRDTAAVQENIELLTGQRGNGLDRAITVRELASLGLISVSRGGNGSVVTKPVIPVVPGVDVPVNVPHAPVSFMAYGGFGSIMLEWRPPTFKGFAHAEIWRAAPDVDGTAPALEQAALIATTPATVFGDIVDPGSTFYYWCRFVNIKDFAGPFHGVDGVKVSTNQGIGGIIDDIGEQMKGSELIQSLVSDISNGDQASQAAINSAKEELASADQILEGALSSTSERFEQAISRVEKEYKAGDLQASTSIKEIESAVVDTNKALVTLGEQIRVEFKDADSTLTTNITELNTVLVNADKVLAERINSVAVDYETADSEIKGVISELSQVVATDDNILAQQIAQMDAAFKVAGESSTQTTNAKITSVQKTFADADSALAQLITELEASYQEADKITDEKIKEVNANITEMDKVLTDADSALAERVSGVEAAFKEADVALAGSITALDKVTAERDKVVADKVDTVQTEIDGVVAAVQQNSQAISSINEDGTAAHQAMWNTKAQAGDIKAGIGILAKSDGTSQVAVSASQFVVFDPNTEGGETQPLFAIDKGNVIIPKALIEKATIQILEAQTIVADEVVAGVQITSPVVNGAKIRGGDAGFGVNGDYSGYHTFITNDGSVYTDRLTARGTLQGSTIVGGDINGTRINGVTIYGSTFIESDRKFTVEGELTYPDGGKILAGYSFYENLSQAMTGGLWTRHCGIVNYNNTRHKTERRFRWSTLGNSDSGVSGIKIRVPRTEGFTPTRFYIRYEDAAGNAHTWEGGLPSHYGNHHLTFNTPVGLFRCEYIHDWEAAGPSDRGDFGEFSAHTESGVSHNRFLQAGLNSRAASIYCEVWAKNYERKP